jgi:hypothetical protein
MDTNVAITVFVGGLFLAALVAIVGGFLHTRRERVLTHQDRMKALDLGREIPGDAVTARMELGSVVSFHNNKVESSGDNEGGSRAISQKAFSTALWVAFWGFLAAAQSVSIGQGPAIVAVAVAIAVSAGAIGVTSVICGTILAVHTSSSHTSRAPGKMLIDSDELDVASRRG